MATSRKRRGERPDGLIQVALDVGYNANGTRKRKYFYGHTRAEAEEKRDEYRAYMQSGSKFKRDITVAEWVNEFKRTYRQNVNEAYLRNDDVPYDRLVKQLGQMRMIDVKEIDLQNALNQVAGMSFSTCNKYRYAMSRLFERARKNKIILDNPADDLELPQYTKGSHRALETWEIELILQHWHDEGLNAGLWVMLMLLCGLRRGEMMALDWKDVNLQTRTLDVNQVAVINGNAATIEQRAKTAAGVRRIPICQPLYEALSATPESARNGFVCLSAHGQPLTESAVSRGLETFCAALERHINGEPMFRQGRRTDIERKKAQQEDQIAKADKKVFSFRAHDLRHTFATLLYDGGVDVKAAQYFLGHANIKITLDLYTHLSKEREVASRNLMVSRFDNLLDSRVTNATPFLNSGENEP